MTELMRKHQDDADTQNDDSLELETNGEMCLIENDHPPEIMDSNGFENGDFVSTVDTESNCSLEDAAARIEIALRRNLKLDDCNGLSRVDEAVETDVTKLTGYQPVPSDCPVWRRDMIERKNKQLEDDAKKELASMKAEEEKWKNVPEWKRSLILEKEKRKQEEMGPTEANRRRQEEELRRLQSMPEWKRNLLLKKKTDDM